MEGGGVENTPASASQKKPGAHKGSYSIASKNYNYHSMPPISTFIIVRKADGSW